MTKYKLHELITAIEKHSPLDFQESYDNSGLQIGNPDLEVSKALICLDITEAVLDEAIRGKFDLIISHHPLVFRGIKKITATSLMERLIFKAIKNNIAIYSAHTNMDNILMGVNNMICNKLGLINQKILEPIGGKLKKLITFCPESHAEKVRNALFDAGAGNIGNYSACSFNSNGQGTFMAGKGTSPFVGKQDELHIEPEIKIETVFPFHIQKTLIKALLDIHPYEEVAYDIIPLENEYEQVGAGMTGYLETEMDELDFLMFIKNVFKTTTIKHSALLGRKIRKVAVCGGSGSFLISKAINSGADIFITGDLKYHQFFEAEQKIILADVGHYESEQFTKKLLHTIIMENFPTFAVQISNVEKNPVNYL